MKLEEAVAKLAAQHAVKADRQAWVRVTRLRHTALAMAALMSPKLFANSRKRLPSCGPRAKTRISEGAPVL